MQLMASWSCASSPSWRPWRAGTFSDFMASLCTSWVAFTVGDEKGLCLSPFQGEESRKDKHRCFIFVLPGTWYNMVCFFKTK